MASLLQDLCPSQKWDNPRHWPGLGWGEVMGQNLKLVTKHPLQSNVSPLSPISEIVRDN